MEERDQKFSGVADTPLLSSSFFVFKPESTLRRRAVKLVSSMGFSRFITFCAITNCIFLSIYDPLDPHSVRSQIANYADFFFLGIFTLEILAQSIAFGFLFGPSKSSTSPYLKSPWNVLDFFILVVGFVNVGTNDASADALRSLRALRPLRLALKFQGIKSVIGALLLSAGMLINVFVATLFFLMFYAIIGVNLFKGKLHQKCVDVFTGDVMDDSYTGCSTSTWFGRQCPIGQTCLANSANPNFGFSSFDHLPAALLIIFQEMTMDNWTKLVLMLEQVAGQGSAVYMMICVVFGTWCLINLALVVINSAFRTAGQLNENFFEEVHQVTNSVVQIVSNKSYHSGSQLSLHSIPSSHALPSFLPKIRWFKKTQKIATKISKSWVLNAFATLAIICNTVIMGMVRYPADPTFSAAEDLSNTVFNYVFLIEVLVHLTASGFAKFFQSPMLVADLFVVLIGFLDFVIPDSNSILVFRAFRLLLVFKFIRLRKRLQKMLSIVLQVLRSLSSLLFLFVVMLFIFTIMGMYTYGGKMNFPEGRPRSHFDDLYASFLTVFVTITGESWSTNMYNGMRATWWGSFFYFLTVFILGSYVFTNILIAIVIEGFRSSESLKFVRNGNSTNSGTRGDPLYDVWLRFLRHFRKDNKIEPEGEEDSPEGGGDIELQSISQNNNNNQIPTSPKNIKKSEKFEENENDDEEGGEDQKFIQQISKQHIQPGITKFKAAGKLALVISLTRKEVSSPPPPPPQVPHFGVGAGLGSQLSAHSAPLRSPHHDLRSPHLIPHPPHHSDPPPAMILPRLFGMPPSILDLANHGNQSEEEEKEKIVSPKAPRRTLAELIQAEKQKEREDDSSSSSESSSTTTESSSSSSSDSSADSDSDSESDCEEYAKITGILEKDTGLQKFLLEDIIESVVENAVREIVEQEFSTESIASQLRDIITDSQHLNKNETSSILVRTDSSCSGNSLALNSQEQKNLFRRESNPGPTSPFEYSEIASTSVFEEKMIEVVLDDTNLIENLKKAAKAHAISMKERVELWRAQAQHILNHPWFDRFVVAAILVSCVTLTLSNPLYQDTDPAVTAIDGVIDCIFVLEISIRIFALGAFRGKKAFFRSVWNIFDFMLVLLSVLDIVLPHDFYALRSFRLLRTFRPLRMVRKFPAIQMTTETLLLSLPGIRDVIIIAFMFFIVFGILGVQLFGGRMFVCSDPSVTTRDKCVGFFQAFAENERPTPRLWMPARANFDNLLNAMLTLFRLTTQDNWPDVMYAATDIDLSAYESESKQDNHRPHALYFVSWIFIGSLFLLNIVVGVLMTKYREVDDRRKIVLEESDNRRTYLFPNFGRIVKTLGAVLPSRPPPPARSRIRKTCLALVTSKKGAAFIFWVVLANFFVMCFEFYGQPRELDMAMNYLGMIFSAIFVLEAIAKIIGLHPKVYFMDAWHLTDFVVTVLSVCGEVIDFGMNLSMIRVSRIFRLLRLFRIAKGFADILWTFFFAIPSFLSIMCLMSLMFFMYGVLGVQLFAKLKFQTAITPSMNFRTLQGSLFILFRVLMLDSWSDVMYDCAVQPPLCEEELDNCGRPVISQFFFCSYVFTNAFILLQLCIAIIIQNYETWIDNQSLDIREVDVMKFADTWNFFDPFCTGYLHVRDILDFVRMIPAPLGLGRSVLSGETFGYGDAFRFCRGTPIVEHGGKVHYIHLLCGLTSRAMLPEHVHTNMERAAFASALDEAKDLIRGRLPPPPIDNGRIHLDELCAIVIVQAYVRGFLQRMRILRKTQKSFRKSSSHKKKKKKHSHNILSKWKNAMRSD